MENQIDQIIASSDYASLPALFNSPTYHSLGQGEQRTISAYFIKALFRHSNSNNNNNNLNNVLHPLFSSKENQLIIIHKILSNLPQTVENALDNTLRHYLFTYLIEEDDDYRNAAIVLSGMRMTTNSNNNDNGNNSNNNNVYHTSYADKTDVYVKIAECFLHEEEYVEAETFVRKASESVEFIDKPEECSTLILRFKSIYARVEDANRKFLEAARRYYDLSTIHMVMSSSSSSTTSSTSDENQQTVMIDNDDLLEFLGRAATCSILARSSKQRQRILGLVYKDRRLSQLDSISHFTSHSSIVKKMYMNQIIVRDDDLIQFESSLGDHQRAIMGDGLTIVQRALIEHNMVAVSHLYASIYFTDLGQLLGLSTDRAEGIACKMITNGTLAGTIDEVDGVLYFDTQQDQEVEVINWDSSITNFCLELNKVTDAIRQHT